MPKKLTVSELRFLEEYASGSLRLSAAFSRAGIKTINPTKKLQELRKNPNFEKALRERMLQTDIENKVQKEMVIGNIADIAFCDIKDFYDDKGNLLPIDKIAPHARRAIVGVRTQKIKDRYGNEHIIVESYEVADKLGALKLLGSTVDLQLFKEVSEKNVNIELSTFSTGELVDRLLTLFGPGTGAQAAPGDKATLINGEAVHLLPEGRPVPQGAVPKA